MTLAPGAASKSFLKAPLPQNVQVMTLERFSANTLLLRMSHQFGVNEDATLSQPVKVDLRDVLGWVARDMCFSERSLSGNQGKASLERALDWSVLTERSVGVNHPWREAG